MKITLPVEQERMTTISSSRLRLARSNRSRAFTTNSVGNKKTVVILAKESMVSQNVYLASTQHVKKEIAQQSSRYSLKI